MNRRTCGYQPVTLPLSHAAPSPSLLPGLLVENCVSVCVSAGPMSSSGRRCVSGVRGSYWWSSVQSGRGTASYWFNQYHMLLVEWVSNIIQFLFVCFFNQGSGFRLLLDKVKGGCCFFLHLLLSLVLVIFTVFDRGRGIPTRS